MTTGACVTRLDDRAVVAITGPDAIPFLHGLVTNDIEALAIGAAAHAGLLSPQGKILFEFLCVRTADGLLLDVARAAADGLVKRLSMYKLRADVGIRNAAAEYCVLALWGRDAAPALATTNGVAFTDPRHPALGSRILADAARAADVAAATTAVKSPDAAYVRHRIALGVPEGGRDYDFGDAYPHEANFDLLAGVSFTKGCYVGQEIVARMQHKTTVRKRIVPVRGAAPLDDTRPDVVAGDIVIGRLGSVSGTSGLALLRLDRAAELIAKGHALTAAGVAIDIDPPQWLPLAALADIKPS
ncbi:MAG: YgfZ/GcvT domain-containing protein [Hyphomicrobium sp.]